MMRSDSGRYLATQRDNELVADALRRNRPWDTKDYERLRKAAMAFTRTPNGRAYWDLLGALDRTGRDD
jgi:hypothetical protein